MQTKKATNKLVKTEIEGLDYVVAVPEDAQPSVYPYGLVVGPPESIAEIPVIGEALHRELVARGIITLKDALSRRQDVHGAVQYVCKIHAERVINLYREAEKGTINASIH